MRMILEEMKLSVNNIEYIKEAIHLVNVSVWFNSSKCNRSELESLFQVKSYLKLIIYIYILIIYIADVRSFI